MAVCRAETVSRFCLDTRLQSCCPKSAGKCLSQPGRVASGWPGSPACGIPHQGAPLPHGLTRADDASRVWVTNAGGGAGPPCRRDPQRGGRQALSRSLRTQPATRGPGAGEVHRRPGWNRHRSSQRPDVAADGGGLDDLRRSSAIQQGASFGRTSRLAAPDHQGTAVAQRHLHGDTFAGSRRISAGFAI